MTPVQGVLTETLEGDSRTVEGFSGGEAFLQAYRPGAAGCLLLDAAPPGVSGIELLEQLRAAGHNLPAIVITGHGDGPMAIRAMKAGASDFIEKPVDRPGLLASVARALERSLDAAKVAAWHAAAAAQVAGLTPRQREIMAMVLAGHPSKNIAADLGISGASRGRRPRRRRRDRCARTPSPLRSQHRFQPVKRLAHGIRAGVAD